MYQLWWVTGGVLESLQNGGLDTSVALKRLLAQADRQIKLVIDEGVDAFDKHPVDDLLNNLLYYVARSSVGGERCAAIREAFNTREVLKVKVQDSAPAGVQGTGQELAAQLENTHLVQVIGRTLVLYRPHPDNPEIELP